MQKATLQKYFEIIYQKENPEITLVTGEGAKRILGRAPASEIFDRMARVKTGVFFSPNHSHDSKPEDTRDEKGKKLISGNAFLKYAYCIPIDKDGGENTFIESPLPLTIKEVRTGVPGYHAYLCFKHPLDMRIKSSQELYKKLANIVQGYFKADRTNDPGRLMRVPYSQHSKPEKKGQIYEITEINSAAYYTPDEIEAAFYNPDEEIYQTSTRYQEKIIEGSRHAALRDMGNTLYGRGLSTDALFDYLCRFNLEYCEPPKKDTEEIKKISLDCIAYIDANGGPRVYGDTPLFPLNQDGFIERLKYYLPEGQVLYNLNSKSWHVFKGKYWNDNILPIYEIIAEIINNTLHKEKEIAVKNYIQQAISEGVAPADAEKMSLKIADTYDREKKQAHTANYKDAVLKLLAASSGYMAMEEENNAGYPVFNQVHDRFNFLNGSFDFNTFSMDVHRWNDYSSVFSPFEYQPDTEKPLFDKFLDDIFSGDTDLINWMQIFLGSCMIGGENRNKIFPVWYGNGDNGKSTLVNIITAIFGDYAHVIRADALAAVGNREFRFDLAGLPGKRLVVAHEGRQGAKLNTSMVNQMTGNDLLICERKGRESFTFKPSFKMILLTNHKPVIHETTVAIWNRVKLVPFLNSIPKEKQDRDLSRKIIEQEGAAVITWLLEGARIWKENDYYIPECDAISGATEQYREDENVLGEWVESYCIPVDDYSLGSSVTELYNDFKEKTSTYMRRSEFVKELERMGFKKMKYQTINFNLALRQFDAVDSEKGQKASPDGFLDDLTF